MKANKNIFNEKLAEDKLMMNHFDEAYASRKARKTAKQTAPNLPAPQNGITSFFEKQSAACLSSSTAQLLKLNQNRF